MRTANLSALTYDPQGHVRLRLHGTTAGETRRRVNRVKTLDGSAVTNDMGYSAADRTLDLRWPAAGATDAAVDRMVQLYTRLLVAVPGAVYLVAPESYTPGATESRLRLLVLEDLTA